MIKRIKILVFKNNLFFLHNVHSILNLRNEYRIQGYLVIFSFSLKCVLLFLSPEEILLGIEFNFMFVKKIKKTKKKKLKLVFEFFKKSINKNYIPDHHIKKGHHVSVKFWRESFLLVFFFKKNYTIGLKKIKYSLNFKNKILTNFTNSIGLENFFSYRIFRDLWYRGFSVTSGIKFGASYLIYAGEISEVHANGSLFNLNQSAYVCSYDVISFGRVGTITKKNCIFVSVIMSSVVFYFGIKWNNNLP